MQMFRKNKCHIVYVPFWICRPFVDYKCPFSVKFFQEFRRFPELLAVLGFLHNRPEEADALANGLTMPQLPGGGNLTAPNLPRTIPTAREQK